MFICYWPHNPACRQLRFSIYSYHKDSVLVVIPLLVIVPSSLMYPMPYAWFLASCSMGSCMFLFLFLDLSFPYVIAWDPLCVCVCCSCSLGSVDPLLYRVVSH